MTTSLKDWLRKSSERKEVAAMEYTLNVVPIIDCLTILIMFLLASGVYVSIGVLDNTLVRDEGISPTPAASIEKSGAEILLFMRPDQTLILESHGEVDARMSMIPEQGTWNFEELNKKLGFLKSVYPQVASVTIMPHADVPYQFVVKAMEVVRATHSDVLLSGF